MRRILQASWQETVYLTWACEAEMKPASTAGREHAAVNQEHRVAHCSRNMKPSFSCSESIPVLPLHNKDNVI